SWSKARTSPSRSASWAAAAARRHRVRTTRIRRTGSVLPEAQPAGAVRRVDARGELLEPVAVGRLEVVAEVLEVALDDPRRQPEAPRLDGRDLRQAAQAVGARGAEAPEQVGRGRPVVARGPHGEREGQPREAVPPLAEVGDVQVRVDDAAPAGAARHRAVLAR